MCKGFNLVIKSSSMEKFWIILSIIIALGAIVLSTYYYLNPLERPPDLKLLKTSSTLYENLILFSLANFGGGIAYVDKIELDVRNFETNSECSETVVIGNRGATESFSPIFIEMKN